MRLAALLALSLWAPPAAASAPSATLSAAAAALAAEVGPPPEGRRALVLAVEARAAALRAPLETALDAALSAEGYAVTPHRSGADAETSARAARQDWLLRVRAGLVPGRSELALVGELIPAWESFFLQRRPGARAIPPRLVQARAAADPETSLLAREPPLPGAPFAAVRPLARVPGRVLALAVGEPGDLRQPAVVAATAEGIVVLSASGERIAARGDAAPPRPVRDPAAAVAVGDFGAGRIAVFRAGAAQGEVLALEGDRLEIAGALAAAPLCAGEAATLFGAFAPGTGVFRDALATTADPAPPARSTRTLYGAACAPRAGPLAFAVLGTDLTLELLGPDLVRVARPGGPAAPPPATGSGFALADLDGDGAVELAASSPAPAGAERIRILAPLEGTLILESAPLAGAILAGAGGDLTGDGVDDAVLAAVQSEGGAVWTELFLVTSDPRGGTP